MSLAGTVSSLSFADAAAGPVESLTRSTVGSTMRGAPDVASAKQQVDQRTAGLLDRSGDGAERRVAEVRAEDVVKADHAHLTGNIDAQVLQSLQHPDGEQVVERDQRGRSAGHADVSRCRPALKGRGEGSPPDHLDAGAFGGIRQRA